MARVVYASLFVVIGILCTAIGTGVGTAAAELPTYPWLNGEPRIVARAAVNEEAPLCTGKEEAIHITRRDYTNPACVFGDFGEVRMAVYTSNQGVAAWAVSFPANSDFYEVKGLCVGVRRCAYNAKADMLALQVASRGLYPSIGFFSHVSSSLERDTDPITATVSYRFVPKEEPHGIKLGDAPVPAGAVAFSDNGKWAVVELHSYGFIRIDLNNFAMRRIVAPGSEYGLGSDPSFELAIADTGKVVAITGMGAGLDIVQVDSDCGDHMTENMPVRFSGDVDRCMFSPFNRTQAFPSFRGGSHPRFSSDGNRLSVSVLQKGSPMERVALVPPDIEPITRLPLLALGDSFSSGEGESDAMFYRPGTNTGVHLCHTSGRSYPFLLASSWGVDAQSVACSGAVLNDVSGSSFYTGEGARNKNLSEEARSNLEKESLEKFQPGNRRQVDFASHYLPKVITVGVGGNDAGLMDKLRVCLGVDICEWAKDDAKRLATAEEIKGSYDKLRTMLRELRSASPESYVIAVGYPLIINDSDGGMCGPLLGKLLDMSERRFMNESITFLNGVMKAAALSEGVMFVDAEDALTGRRLCDKTSDAMNGIRFGNDVAPLASLPLLKIIGAESFHPTPVGHSLMLQSILSVMPSAPARGSCSDCATERPAPEPIGYWRQSGTTQSMHRQIRAEVVPDHSYKPAEVIPMSVSAFHFAPHSMVKIELHSEPLEIATVSAGGDGSVAGPLEIPASTPEGYHTLHLYGTAWTGEPIDLYQVIPVEQKEGLLQVNVPDQTPPTILTTPLQPGPFPIAAKVPPLTSVQTVDKPPILSAFIETPVGTSHTPLHLSTDSTPGPFRPQAKPHPKGMAPLVIPLILAILIMTWVLLALFQKRQKPLYQV